MQRIRIAAALAGFACAALLMPCAGAAPPVPAADRGPAEAGLDGIVDLLDPDYLQRPINVARLPLRYATTVVHGRGERVLYTFEDPECGYCRELARRLEAIGNVTVHTFVVALFGEASRAKANRVWCAGDRSAAWLQLMTTGKFDAPPRDGCAAPLAETKRLAEMLGVSFTPTVFFSDGSRMLGLKPRAEIEQRLGAAAASTAQESGGLASEGVDKASRPSLSGRPAREAKPGLRLPVQGSPLELQSAGSCSRRRLIRAAAPAEPRRRLRRMHSMPFRSTFRS